MVGEETPVPTRNLPLRGAENGDNGRNVLQTLRLAHVQEHSAILTAYVKEQIANILRIPAQRLDTEQPLTTLGFDSLMAIELKNRIDLDLQIRLPIVTLLQGPSITQFVRQLLGSVSDSPLPRTLRENPKDLPMQGGAGASTSTPTSEGSHRTDPGGQAQGVAPTVPLWLPLSHNQ